MILHLAVARFKPDTDPAIIRNFFEEIGTLHHDVPGIVNYSWGVNDSPEGLSQGFTHGMAMTLRDAQVREAYLNHPRHLALKQAVLPHLDNVVVVDYPVQLSREGARIFMHPAPASDASLIYRPASWLERLPLPEMFPVAQPLEVELGSGDGSFLAQWAEAQPGVNFLGIERLLGRLRKLDRKARRRSLHNVRLMRIEAGYFLEYLLPHRSTSALHIYFPDPWPKRRHRKYRLVNARFPEIAAQALVEGGIVYLRTDDGDYFTQMREVFAASPGFTAVETPADLAAVVTDFERDFNAKGIPTNRAAYRLK